MSTVVGLSRNAAEALVAREERRTGSRMSAYEAVARSIGTSAEWLRKFIQRTEGKEPKLSIGFNILSLYCKLCDCVEQHRDNELELKREIDAAMEAILRVVDRTAATQGVRAQVHTIAETPAGQGEVGS